MPYGAAAGSTMLGPMLGVIGRVAVVSQLLLLSCSLVSPSEDSLEQAKSCAHGTKRCGEQCVSVDDPATGCGEKDCDPCSLSGAEAMCVAGHCRISACQPGRGDCDGAPANGCEAALDSDAEHCGACGSSCALAGTETTCSAGKCQVTGCVSGHTDCNASDADGCEVELATNPKHCGACGAACQLPDAVAGCAGGACLVAACVTGRGDCDGKLLNGCEVDLAKDPDHCGACGATCAPAHGKGECSVGVCEVTSCSAGWGDCNKKASDGCEADLASDPKNCGACGATLPTGQSCAAGLPALDDVAFSTWLGQQNGGWCNDQFTKFMNLCGTTSYCSWDKGTVYPGGVMFCCDPKLMRTYPDGLAFDMGFHWDGVSKGILLDAGADCESKRVSCVIESGILTCLGPGSATSLKLKLTMAGRLLVSYRVSTTANELWVNGVLAGTGAGSGIVPELAAKCGSGFNLGQRISYWWESTPPGNWLRNAPFLFHLKDQAPPAGKWTLAETIAKTSRSVMLFDSSAVSGDAWTDVVAGQTGLLCGGKDQAAKEGYPVPCPGKKWVSDVTQCL